MGRVAPRVASTHISWEVPEYDHRVHTSSRKESQAQIQAMDASATTSGGGDKENNKDEGEIPHKSVSTLSDSPDMP